MRGKRYFALLLTFFLTFGLNSQVLPPMPPPPNPPGLPIDAGALFLFISGLIYGIKKMKRTQ